MQFMIISLEIDLFVDPPFARTKGIYEGGLKSSYDDVIYVAVDFFTGQIQALQLQWKKCVHRKRNYVEK